MATTPRAPTINTDGLRYPTDILRFNVVPNNERGHTTEKPVDLLEFLVRTYTDLGQTVLDPFMGSGSCGEACLRSERKFIGVEKTSQYFDIAEQRLRSAATTETQIECYKPEYSAALR